MPARQSASVYCHCERCTDQGGARGIAFQPAALRAHQMRVSRERAQLEEEGAHMLALTLTDDGLDPESAPSRLWMSHEDFQEINRHDPPFPINPPTVPLDTILEGVSRLQISSTTTTHPPFSASAVPPPLSSSTPEPPLSFDELVEVFGRVSISDDDDAPTLPASDSRDNRKLQKKENSRHTKRAKDILNAIATEARAGWAKRVSDRMPTTVELSEMESTVTRLRSVFESVTRSTPSLIDCKREVLESLDQLEGYVLEWRLLVPDDTQDPVQYNCGKDIQASSLYRILTRIRTRRPSL
jgi:hypothetical protein